MLCNYVLTTVVFVRSDYVNEKPLLWLRYRSIREMRGKEQKEKT